MHITRLLDAPTRWLVSMLALTSVCALGSCGSANESGEELDPARAGKPTALSCDGVTEDVSVDPDGDFYTTKMEDERAYIFDEVRKTIYTLRRDRDPNDGANYSNFCDMQENCVVTASEDAVVGVMVDDEEPMLRRREIKINRIDGSLSEVFRYRGSSGSQSFSKSAFKCTPKATHPAYLERFGPRQF